MTDKHKQRTLILLVAIANVIGWCIPSRIDYLVAQQRHVLLTRYSIEYFTALLLLLIISFAVLYIFLGDIKKRKEKIFGVISIFIGVVISSIVIDIGVRMIKTSRYVKTDNVYHRQPNKKVEGVFKDEPIMKYSYPFTPKGFPDVPYALTIDELGFRNPKKLENCEVLMLGDSFTEGSSVSDDQSWPALYAKMSGKKIYNLGMSGGNPSTYVESFEKFGLSLSPKRVFCMIYEGNDFKGKGELIERAVKEGSLSRKIRRFQKTFYFRYTLKRLFIKYLSISNWNYDTPPGDDNLFSWLPVKLPQTENSKYYAFELKKIIRHYQDKPSFKNSKGCITALLAVQKLSDLCEKNNIDFQVVYAPEKSHVIMPLVKDRLDAEKLRQYFELKIKDLPDAEETKKNFYSYIENKEDVIREYCQKNNIKFISTTRLLRTSILNGTQAYFTYDQHWSPDGQKVVANFLYNQLAQ